jgi:biopolymer transport protein ExbD
MIDVCFQLIIFFMVSLRLFSPEGDFSITMPVGAPREGLSLIKEPSLPVKIRLLANRDGTLAGIQMGQRKLSSFVELQHQIREISGLDRGPAGSPNNAEVELECDYELKFEYVISALSAVSGYLAADKQTVVRMIEKIRFAPPHKSKEEGKGERN